VYVPLASMPDAGGKDTSASGSLPTFNLSSDSTSDSDDSDDSDSDFDTSTSVPTFHPASEPCSDSATPDPDVSGSSAPSGSCSTAPGTRTAPNAGPHLTSSWIPLPSASPAPDDDVSTPRSTPDAPSNLCRSTRARKSPGQYWMLPKDRQPALPPVPETSDSGSDVDTAVHLANCAANCALSHQELIEYAFLTSGNEPRTLRDALQRDDAPMWQEAAQYNALLEHGVWDLAECLADRKPIGCGCSRSSTKLMVLLSTIRLILWQRALPRNHI